MSPNSDKPSVLLSLLSSIDAEIAYYRQRQISIFREHAIVLGLVTWGVGKLGFAPERTEMLVSRFAAGVARILATIIGCILIINFRNRIHYVRDKKTEIIENIFKSISMDTVQISYPVPQHITEEFKNNKSYYVAPSSNIYIWLDYCWRIDSNRERVSLYCLAYSMLLFQQYCDVNELPSD
jgi:hypothetical protein